MAAFSFLKPTSIRARLITLITALTGLICLAIYLLFPRYLENQALRILGSKAGAMANLTAMSLATPVYFEDRVAIDETISMVRRNQDVTFLLVEDNGGHLFGDVGGNPISREDFSDVDPLIYSVSRDKNLLMIRQFIVHNEERIGNLYMGFTLENINDGTRFSRQIIAMVSVFLFLVVHLLGSWISTIITRPLNDMVEAATRITAGDLESRARISSSDEVGHLAKAFNLMVERVGKTYQELEDINHYLEDRVTERTHELENEVRGHKRTLIALREERDRAQLYLDVAEVMLVAVDTSGKVALINQKGCKVLGYKEEEIVGRPWVEFLPDMARDAAQDKINAIMNGQLNVEEYTEDEVLAHDGSVKLIAWRNTRVFQHSGQLQGVLRSGEDISKIRTLEKQLRHSQKMEAIGTLAGGIAHDFNNILTGIIWCAQLSLEDAGEDSGIAGYQRELLKAANRAKDLVQQILTFSRQQEIEKGPTELHLVVKEALKLLGASLPNTIKIMDRIDDKAGTILADATQLHQIVMNLCTNAYQAMGEKGGTLSIELKRLTPSQHQNPKYPKTEVIRFTVVDTGTGIEDSVIERIFDPFFTTKPVNEGTGMGLSVVHGIVTDHGGSISVSSKPGHGTQFKVDFPVHEGRVVVEPANHKPTTGRERVLFVDDEPELSRMAATVLNRLGYHTTFFTSPERALEAFSKDPGSYDVVVTDQVMPEMVGTDLATMLRAHRADLPIIFTTGFSEIINRESAQKWAPCDYIRKPFAPRELAARIRAFMDGLAPDHTPEAE